MIIILVVKDNLLVINDIYDYYSHKRHVVVKNAMWHPVVLVVTYFLQL
jgi:hypothetical protein